MRIVVYQGRADAYSVDGRVIPRGVPTEVPNHLAEKLTENGDFTVEEPSNEGVTEGETNGS